LTHTHIHTKPPPSAPTRQPRVKEIERRWTKITDGALARGCLYEVGSKLRVLRPALHHFRVPDHDVEDEAVPEVTVC